jgi:protein phosphatase PTC1
MGIKLIYVANVGDTRAVLSKNGRAERLSYDHKGSDRAEVDRVRSGGGIVIENRVGGSLAVTRAFGDLSLKRDGVIAKPFIKKHVLRGADKFLVIATDGVWDVMEDQDAINYCKDEFSTKEIA